ncbi:hypothetical protein KR018_010308 [Drosophila ironensis]|nr:hypothetical protein KR018_010308 [Drosophila ironensis]
MFNFHKPRVYRSAEGCCICRAKSSSSRFTASRKYEKESMQCFNLDEPRNGEICNACVLLVKRYKRLPTGSKRHWGHVVDARAGPGTKSIARQKKRVDSSTDSDARSTSSSNSTASSSTSLASSSSATSTARAPTSSGNCFLPEKFTKIFKKSRRGKALNLSPASSSSSSSASSAKVCALRAGGPRIGSSSPRSEAMPSDSNESYDDEHRLPAAPYQTRKRTAAKAALMPTPQEPEVIKRPKITGCRRRRQLAPQKNRRAVDNVPFFEESDLVRVEVCCGVVFQSLALGSSYYIIDPDLYQPCEKHLRLRKQQEELLKEDLQKEELPKKQLQEKELPKKQLPEKDLPKKQPQKEDLQKKQEEEEKENEKAEAMAKDKAEAVKPVPTVVQKVGPLKKHHLFFKRQSESFPQGDIHSISAIPLSKTEASNEAPPPTTTKPPHSNLSLVLKPIVATVSVGAASPSSLSSSSNCSTSSTVTTKFSNDNSSDSGFDEHVLERKSISPPSQEEWKLRGATGGGMQLILASGLPISGQAQNLVLAGNEFTARIVQQRQQQPGEPIKINVLGAGAVGGGGGGGGAGSQGSSSNKMRAIFNSASSIQHENGVTTILPASSLAASNQTAAMNAIAPSTVTITPSSVGKKVAAQLGVNPKFILLKPAKITTVQPPPPPEAKIA